jgi:hypothetical protein
MQNNNEEKNSEIGSPTKTDFNKTSLSNAKKVEVKVKKLEERDPIQNQLEQLGRYWIW